MTEETGAPTGGSNTSQDVKKSLGGLEASIEKINKGLPGLPDSAKEWIVKVLPWLILIGAIISLPAIIAIFGLGSLFGSVAYWGGLYSGTTFYITWVLMLIVFILEIAAIGPLLKRSKAGWNLIFYGALITALSNLISLSIASLIIGLVIELYILFQIRSYYK